MRKGKLYISILTGLCACFMGAAFSACGGEEGGEKHTHSYTSQTTEASCAENGLITYTCSCGDSYTEEIPVLGHDEKTHEAKAPTCAEIGWEEYATCEREGCEYSTYEEIPATGEHTWSDGKETSAPTCTKEGVTTYTCTVCETATKTEPIAMLPHEHSTEWESNATHHWHECACSDKADEAGHTPSAPATVTTPQTCTACGYVMQEATGILFNTLFVDGTTVYGKFRNAITEFSFVEEITIKGKADFAVAKDEYGSQTYLTKTVPLSAGNNVFYVFEMLDGKIISKYTVTIYRNPIYTVSFDTDGGTLIEGQGIEEGFCALKPETETLKAGYTFVEWDYDFSKPVMQDVEIKAKWSANKDTKYTVNYYLQDKYSEQYSWGETVELSGQTDTVAEAEIKTYDHFTYNKNKSISSGVIDGNGTLTLHIYYTRNQYTISVERNNGGGTVTSGGRYYADEQVILRATTYAGYDFLGWYKNGELVCETEKYAFYPNQTAQYIAKWKPRTDTKYTIEYYWQKIDTESYLSDEDYELGETEILEGTTGTFIEFDRSKYENKYEHFTYSDRCRPSGTIKGDGSLVLRVYYTRNSYTVDVQKSAPNAGTVVGGGSYPFEKEITLQATAYLGYNFLGWYEGESLVCEAEKFTFSVQKKVTYVAMFETCEGMEKFNFTSTETSCTIEGLEDLSVEELTIPDCVTGIANRAFYNCSNLTKVVIPDSVTSIGKGAFSECSNLTEITLPFVGASKDGTNHTHFGFIFGAGSYSDNDDYVPTSLKEVTITSAVSIGDYAFTNCPSLTSAVIGDGVTSIGNYAFGGCSGLTSMEIPNSVTSISEGAFYNCESLTSVEIPESVTSIGAGAFHYCIGLTEIVIPNSVVSIGAWAFAYCASLIKIEIPNSVASIGDYAFALCINATKITIGSGVTSIGEIAFGGCSSVTNITVDANNKTYKDVGGDIYSKDGTTIIQYACGKTDVSFTIPDSVTSISSAAFVYCTSLTNVVIPDSVTSIGDSAFEECSSLTNVYYKGAAEDWANISIDSYNEPLTNATRYYYSETAPSLNADGTAYDGNYWHYDENGNIVVWVYTKPEE